ncbi:hypothetical protein RQM59_11465 [Flavobacteriaceae bacterium S356]|uniref:Uncharacterized protein n=1 Tax=Asprobacillus argus TaxID=3076534 RepID=A0ABU3LIQ8_9FLAO|nr:hypothetical protein [Flavobacteriaceae bacterium S356]
MKAKKLLLFVAITCITAFSYGQSKSTYEFENVQKNEQSLGKDCTLIIDKKENIYTFSFKSVNGKSNFQVAFKLRGNTAFVIGDDAPKPTQYNVVSDLDSKGSILFVPKQNSNNAFAYSFTGSN